MQQTRLGRLLARLLLNVMLITHGTALASTCMRPDHGEFLHLTSHDDSILLPVNALGILFRTREYLSTLLSDAQTTIVGEMPVALRADSFSIRERASGRRLAAKLTRLDIDQQILSGPPTRYFLADRRLTRCMGTKNTSLCSQMATLDEATRDNSKAPGQVATFARQLGLREIGDEIARAFGLFRIGPAQGFKTGVIYDIRYHADDLLFKATIHIVPALLTSNTDHFALEADGRATRRGLRDSDDSCMPLLSAMVQPLKVALPPAYEPYRASLSYFFQHKLSKPDRLLGHVPANKFFNFRYQPLLCSRLPYGGTSQGDGRELVYADCDAAFARQVKVYVGMLELEDKLHETAPLDISFNDALPGQCPEEKYLCGNPVIPVYAVPSPIKDNAQ